MRPQEADGVMWRDRLVALTCWFAVFLAVAGFWSSTTLGMPLLPRIDSATPLPGLLAIVATAGLLAVLIIPAIVVLLRSSIPGKRLIDRCVRAFQAPFTYALLTFLLGLVILILAGLIRRDLTGARSAALVAAAGLAFWLTYRRDGVDSELGVLSITWVILLALAASGLALTRGHIDFSEASWRSRVFITGLTALLTMLMAMPIAALLPSARKSGRRLLHSISRIPPVIFAVGCSMLGAMLLAYGFIDSPSYALGLWVEYVRIAFVLAAAGLVFRLAATSHPEEARPEAPTRPGMYPVGFASLAIVYLLLAIPVAHNQRYLLSPDVIDYLLIARKYAMGDFVVRGYWSPLISWILAPFIRLGGDPQVSLRALGVIVGGVWVLISDRLAGRAGLSWPVRVALALAMILLVVTFGFKEATTDMLGACMIALYLYWITAPNLWRHPIRYGLLIGLAGVLAYFGKYYNLTFVIPSLLLSGMFLSLHGSPPRGIIRALIVAMVVITLGTLSWGFAIHSRYGQFTISTSAGINRAFVSPHFQGMLVALSDKPPDLLIPSEDPQPWAYPGHDWNPFATLDDFRAQVGLIPANLWAWGNAIASNLGPLPLLGLIYLAGSLIDGWRLKDRRLLCGGLLVTGLLYVAAYMLTWSGGFRYYLALFPFLLIGVFLAAQRFHRLALGSLAVHRSSNWVVSTVLLLGPMLSLTHLNTVGALVASHPDPCMADASHAIAPLLVEPIAGLEKSNSALAYYAWKRTLGFLPWDTPAVDVDAELKSMHVRTFVIPADSDKVDVLVSQFGYSLVTQAQLCQRVFAVLRVPTS